MVDILSTLIKNGNFETLVTAIKASDIEITFAKSGTLTLVAPTDAAFEQLPPGTLENLLKPENVDALNTLLKCHLFANVRSVGEMISSGLPDTYQSLGGGRIRVAQYRYSLKANEATVVLPDIAASNGFIHGIDQVLTPPSPVEDVLDTAVNTPYCDIFETLVLAANFAETLKGSGPFTLFAPDYSAFSGLPKGTIESWLQPKNKALLTKILSYHVVLGNWTTAAIIARRPPLTLKTLAGPRVLLTNFGGQLKVNGGPIRLADDVATNGMVHQISKVLIPTRLSESDPTSLDAAEIEPRQ